MTAELASAGAGAGASSGPTNTIPTFSSAFDAALPFDRDADASVRELRDVHIRFRGLVASRELACGESYEGLGTTGARSTPRDFRFFVQEVHLLDATGRALPVELTDSAPFQSRDVALINFTDQRGRCNGDSVVNVELTGRAPAGETVGIELVLGVPETRNHQDFSAARPPLADPSMYWGWTVGYRFLIAALEVQPDAADGGNADPVESFVHVGSDGCSHSDVAGYTCTRPFRAHVRLDDFDPDRDVITADLAQVFADVDLTVGLACHELAPGCELAFAALGLDVAGESTQAQHVFAVQHD